MSEVIHRIKVTSVHSWGGQCPFQITAMCADGRPLYLRARHDSMRIEVGKPGDLDGVFGDTIVSFAHPDSTEEWGWVTLRDVIVLTQGYIKWPLWLVLRSFWEGNRFVQRHRAKQMLKNMKKFTQELEARKVKAREANK